MRWQCGAVVIAMLLTTACGEEVKGNGWPPVGNDLAYLTFGISTSPGLAGKSLYICGERDEYADSKYACLNEACKCFDVLADGSLVDHDTHKPGHFGNLCPSRNHPAADWTFTYGIHAEQGCTGKLLNPEDEPWNFACYDVGDVVTRANRNRSVETLDTGLNENNIICITRQSKKDFDFDLCDLEKPKPSDPEESTRFDCGCNPGKYDECVCDQNLSGLPENCTFDQKYCDIVCNGNGNGPPPPGPAVFLVIDEDSIDNGPRYWPGNAVTFTQGTLLTFSASDVNDDIAALARRNQLRFFANNVGSTIWLVTGQVGDEGWFAPKTIPASWANTGPTADGLRNFLGNPSLSYPHNVGPGLGTGGNPEQFLDNVPNVTPLRAEGLWGLIDRTVCAVVYDSDISINYGPLQGSLKGANRGTVAFKVLDVVHLTGFSSSTLPRVQLQILDANVVCEGPQTLYTDAPIPSSSSVPADVKPNDPSDNTGYVTP